MNPQSDVLPELPLEQQAGVPAAMARTRPFWSQTWIPMRVAT